jgi:hypothetical protein
MARRAPAADQSIKPFDEVPVSPLDLALDPYNPRLSRDEEGSSQSELLEIMLRRFQLDELAESMIAIGFQPFDPIVVTREKGKLVVLEGNRRVAVLKLLLRPESAPPRYESTWRAYRERLSHEAIDAIHEIGVRVYPRRDSPDVRAYIGFRHVTGVLTWPAFEKATFIAELVERQGWDFRRVAERLGSRAGSVEHHYVARQLVEQARDLEIPGHEQMEQRFGVLLRALQTASIREFLGITYTHDAATERSPVPEAKLQDLRDFVARTFGTDERRRVLPESRRLNDWGKILTSPAALGYMRRAPNPDFDLAFFRSGGQADSLAEALATASDRLQESVPLVSSHIGNPEVEQGVRDCALFLRQILHYFPEIAAEHRLKVVDD